MQKRLVELRERLLKAGMAPRHVRRYVRELADHFADVCAEEEALGKSKTEADAAALERLGSSEQLAQAMIAKPELRAWSARAPWAVFGAGPVACLAATYGTACAILFTGWRIFIPGSGTPFVAIDGWAIPYFGIGRMLYWGGPLVVGWCIALVAARQRLRVKWPLLGMGVVALIGCLVQVHARRPDATGAWGQVSLGLAVGRSDGAILRQLAYALVLFAFVALPYAIWRGWRTRAAA